MSVKRRFGGAVSFGDNYICRVFEYCGQDKLSFLSVKMGNGGKNGIRRLIIYTLLNGRLAIKI
jgi:hypothetical protein